MKTYVIAEVGQNHNGSVELAEDLIRMAADPRPHDLRDEPHLSASAVKFTKRDLSLEGTYDYMTRPYGGPHAFGPTYGEHRAALELGWSELYDLRQLAAELGLEFGLTLCQPTLVEPALSLSPDFLKVASRDLLNVPLLRELDRTDDVRIIASTGMWEWEDVDDALEHLARVADARRLTLLHCRSIYPAPPETWGLERIPEMIRWWAPRIAVGYSDHSIGVLAAALAVALGATVVEKHITLDRTMKGTDQAGSVERDGLWRLLRNVSEAERGYRYTEWDPALEPARAKLGRSLAWAVDLTAGHVVTEADLVMLSPGIGLPYEQIDRLLSRKLSRDVRAMTLSSPSDVA